MANHVYCNIEVRNASDNVVAYLSELVTSPPNAFDYCINYDMLYDNFDGEETRAWMTENVGAKWLQVEDVGGDYLTVMTAWDSPDQFFQILCEKLQTIQNNVEVVMHYEDEMPNFFGVWVYDGLGQEFDNLHIDDSEYEADMGVRPMDMDDIAELHSLDIDDDYDQIDELMEENNDKFRDEMHNQQYDFIQEWFAVEEELV